MSKIFFLSILKLGPIDLKLKAFDAEFNFNGGCPLACCSKTTVWWRKSRFSVLMVWFMNTKKNLISIFTTKQSFLNNMLKNNPH